MATADHLRRTALTGLARLGVQPIGSGARKLVANHVSVTKASVTFAHYVQYDYAKEKRAALNLRLDRIGTIVADPPAALADAD